MSFEVYGEKLLTERDAVAHLAKVFNISNTIEKDGFLDELYVQLMSYEETFEVSIIELDDYMENLGRFGLGVIKVFRDAARENDLMELNW